MTKIQDTAMMPVMDQKKPHVSGKFISSTKTWQVVASRDGRKATAKGPTLTGSHRAALAALALMEKISKEEKEPVDLPVVPEGVEP